MQYLSAEQEIEMYWREVERKAPEEWRFRHQKPQWARLLSAALRSILALFAR
jgi:hypothetical protein